MTALAREINGQAGRAIDEIKQGERVRFRAISGAACWMRSRAQRGCAFFLGDLQLCQLEAVVEVDDLSGSTKMAAPEWLVPWTMPRTRVRESARTGTT